MNAIWHYSRSGQRTGPISAEDLKKLADGGELSPSDLVWKVGMPAWQTAGSMRGLFNEISDATTNIANAAVAVAEVETESENTETESVDFASANQSPIPTATAVSYYTPAANSLPPRTAKLLKGFPPLRGAQGQWLDDSRLAQLKETERWRKQIRIAARLYRFLFTFNLVFVAVYAVLIAWSLIASSGGMSGPNTLILFIPLAIFGVSATLLHFAAKCTKRCAIWAPLTMFILSLVSCAIYILNFIFGISPSHRQFDTAAIIIAVFGFTISIVISVLSWKAFKAIPRFLQSPAWCVEALVSIDL